ncbi:MAG: hypothetical protein WBA57_24740 [Elainellaceae cyanobacterium]
MELSLLALDATKIALWAVDKVSGGALEKAGSDVLGFLVDRFQGKLQVRETKPELLEAAILSEAQHSKEFQVSLERLVKHYQSIQNTSVSQTTESGVNLSVSGNSGTVVGQQFFR